MGEPGVPPCSNHVVPPRRTRAGVAAGPREVRPVGVETPYFLQITTKLIVPCTGLTLKQPELCDM
jgi:hypothetical protein